MTPLVRRIPQIFRNVFLWALLEHNKGAIQSPHCPGALNAFNLVTVYTDGLERREYRMCIKLIKIFRSVNVESLIKRMGDFQNVYGAHRYIPNIADEPEWNA